AQQPGVRQRLDRLIFENALPNVEVIEVVRRCDLYAAGPEFGIDVVVGDDRDEALRSRQANGLANQFRVTRVHRMYRDGDVAEHGLGSRGGYRDAEALAGIADFPNAAVLFLGIDLQIGNGRAEHGVPVDQALAAVDEAGVVPPDEHFGHGARHLRVHGEVAALPSLGVGVLPVSGSTEAAHLPRDGGPGLLLPLPDALNKFFAPEIVACLLLEFELALDHDLRSDAGVVGADHPVGVVAAHAVIANERVHQRLLEGVAHVQGAGDVR